MSYLIKSNVNILIFLFLFYKRIQIFKINVYIDKCNIYSNLRFIKPDIDIQIGVNVNENENEFYKIVIQQLSEEI